MKQNRRTVAVRLHSASIHLLRRVRTVDGESGLSPARLSALSVLVYGGPTTIGELARAEGVRSPTMTALVSQLEADGLVRRHQPGTTDESDRRKVLVEPTAKGTDLMHAAQQRRLDLLEALLHEAAPTLDQLRTLDAAATLLEAVATAEGSATPAATGTPAPAKRRASRPSAGTARKPARGRRSS